MAETDKQVEVEFGAKIDGLQSSLAQLQQDFAKFATESMTKMNSITSATDKLIDRVKTLAKTYLGLAAIKEAISDTAKMAAEANKLANQMAISAEEASVLVGALGDIHSSTDEFATAQAFLTRAIRTNEERLNALGLVTRKTDGSFKDSKTLMLDAIQVLAQYKQGFDRNAASQEFFGRGALELQKLFRLTNEQIEISRAKLESLGLLFTKQGQTDAKKYKDAMHDVHQVIEALQKVIGEALMPVLTSLGTWFAQAGPDLVTGFKFAINLLTSAIWGLVFVVQFAVEAIAAGFRTLATVVVATADIMIKAIQGDWVGVKAAWAAGTGQIADTWHQTLERVTAKAKETWKGLQELWSPDKTGAGRVGKDGGKGYTPKETGADDKRLQGWEAELTKQRDTYERMKLQQGSFQEWSKAQDAAYWKAILDRNDLSDKERAAVTIKYYTAEREARKKHFEGEIADLKTQQEAAKAGSEKRVNLAIEQARRIGLAYGLESKEYKAAIAEVQRVAEEHHKHMIQLQEVMIERTTQEQEHEVQMEREKIETLRALGQIKEEEKVKALMKLEDTTFNIQLDALQQQLLLYVDDEIQYEQHLNRILELKRKHDEKMQQMDRELSVARKAEWDKWFTPAQDAFEKMITGVLQGTQRLSQVFRNALVGMLSSYLNMLFKMGVEWLKTEVFKTQATVAGTTARTAAESTGASQSFLITAGSAIKSIGAKAWEAAASVYASIAQIPYIGPFLAPVMAVAAAGTVLAFAKNIFSAAGGMDVPSGVNPMTQLHEREMVLPQHLADPLRAALAGGGGMGGGGNTTIHIHALDTQDVIRGLTKKGALSKALRISQRNGS